MMTLSPLNPDLFYPIMGGWPWGQLEDPTIHHDYVDPINNSSNNLLPYYAQTSESIVFVDHSLPLTSDPQQLNLQENKLNFNSSDGNVTGLETPTSLKVKKLNHNASERDRRKRINDLYSSLRSLLPAADHKKKLSIPATVSRVVKYIPELQKEVNKLIKEKEEIASRICCKEKKSSVKIHHDQKKIIDSKSAHDPAVNIDISAREIGDREITIQICVADDDSEKWRFPEVLQTLEDVGFLLLGVSSFTSGHRLFRNMHFKQVEGSQSIECDALEREILYLYQKRNSF